MLRRNFLTAPLLLGVTNNLIASSVSGATSSALSRDKALVSYVASTKSRLGETSFVCLNSDAEQVSQHDIPSRGHSFACSVNGHVAAIARRPADFCLIIDRAGKKIAEFTAAPNRHFYGHGVYDPKGEFLYLTENDYGFKGSRGVVGVYSVAGGYQRINEFDSGGIGPHQIILSADTSELIIANGGIQTHPESGRKKLNLKTMKPSLAFVNRQSGFIRQNLALDKAYSTNSIRHITQHSSGRVYVALQQQVKTEQTCLLAEYDPIENTLSKLPLQKNEEAMLSGYVGDIALDSTGQYLAVTSPYGNVVLIIDLNEERTYSLELDDVCGLNKSASDALFVVTTGQGKVFELSLVSNKITKNILADTRQKSSWDNHLISMI